MNKKLLALLLGFAAGCAVLAAGIRAQETPAPTASGDNVSPAASPSLEQGLTPAPAPAPAPPPAPAPQFTAPAENKSTPASDNKLFRKKRSDRKKQPAEETKKDVSTVQPAEQAPSVPAPKKQAKQPKERAAAIKKPVTRIKGKADRYIAEAKEYYVEGELEDSEKNINLALQLEPQNAEALRFKNKITVIKEKMFEAKRDFSEQCYFKGAYFFKKSDPLDALLLIDKAVKLNPQSEKARALYAEIQEANQNLIKSMGKKDGKTLRKAIDYFMRGDFEKSVESFRKLQAVYSDIANYTGYANAHTSDERNRKRSEEYVQQAVKDVRNERYKKAQEDLFQALEMDRDNMDAQVILEQVKIELNLMSREPGDLSPQAPPQVK